MPDYPLVCEGMALPKINGSAQRRLVFAGRKAIDNPCTGPGPVKTDLLT